MEHEDPLRARREEPQDTYDIRSSLCPSRGTRIEPRDALSRRSQPRPPSPRDRSGSACTPTSNHSLGAGLAPRHLRRKGYHSRYPATQAEIRDGDPPLRELYGYGEAQNRYAPGSRFEPCAATARRFPRPSMQRVAEVARCGDLLGLRSRQDTGQLGSVATLSAPLRTASGSEIHPFRQRQRTDCPDLGEPWRTHLEALIAWAVAGRPQAAACLQPVLYRRSAAPRLSILREGEPPADGARLCRSCSTVSPWAEAKRGQNAPTFTHSPLAIRVGLSGRCAGQLPRGRRAWSLCKRGGEDDVQDAAL